MNYQTLDLTLAYNFDGIEDASIFIAFKLMEIILIGQFKIFVKILKKMQNSSDDCQNIITRCPKLDHRYSKISIFSFLYANYIHTEDMAYSKYKTNRLKFAIG